MENLTPFQRIVTIALGLALTAAVVIWGLPWAGREIAARIPPTRTPVPATSTPTATPTTTPTPGPSPTPTVALTPAAAAVMLEPVAYSAPLSDTCGLAALGIVMQHWGYTDTHTTITPILCPGAQDTYAQPDELIAYARSRNLEGLRIVNGNPDLIQQFVANGLPVLISQWITVTRDVKVGQYEVVRGYDKNDKVFIIHDVKVGPDVALSFEQMDRDGQPFNRQLILIYPPTQAVRVRAILGKEWSEKGMWEAALLQADKEIKANAKNAAALLNKSEALFALESFAKSKEAFDQAIQAGVPPRLTWYRPHLYQCLLKVEDYETLLKRTQGAIDQKATVEEFHLYRAQAYAAQNKVAQARQEYNRALAIHPNWKPAQDGLLALPQ